MGLTDSKYTKVTEPTWYDECKSCGEEEAYCFTYCQKCKTKGKVYHSLKVRKCYFCDDKFSPKRDTFICRGCFDEPYSYQHHFYAAKEAATDFRKDFDKIPSLSRDKLDSIKKDIYGY